MPRVTSAVRPRVSTTQAAPSLSPVVGVLHTGGEFGVVALRDVEPGEVLMTIEGERVGKPSRTSVQVSERDHIDVPAAWTFEEVLARAPWRFLNHACAPTAWVRGREVVALRRMARFDAVTFDYTTTEAAMATPFVCRCGACGGREIRGFVHLEADEQRRRLPHLAPWLRARVEGPSPRVRGSRGG